MSEEKKQGFFARAFEDMKQSAREQHEVDKAEFNAVKAESHANWEEAKAASKPSVAAAKRRA